MEIIMKKVLIFQGGWDGHDPVGVSERFASILKDEGYAVDIFDSFDCLRDAEKLLTGEIAISMGMTHDEARTYLRENLK
jgi:type 1 glutamine amidotransferase